MAENKLVIEISLDEDGAIPGILDFTRLSSIAPCDIKISGVVSRVAGHFLASYCAGPLPAVKVFDNGVNLMGAKCGLPEGVEEIGGCLDIRGCTAERPLPSTLKYVGGIVGLGVLPSDGFPEGLEYGDSLVLSGVTVKPARDMWIRGNLYLNKRTDITEWPDGLKVDGYADIRGSSIDPKSVPDDVVLYQGDGDPEPAPDDSHVVVDWDW